MDNKAIRKQLIAIILPIAAQNLLSALVSASDALMLGGLNQESLSAVSLATQVTFVSTLFYMALTIGATTLAAQYWGKKQTEKVEDILSIVLKYSMIVSITFWALTLFTPRFLMRIFTNETILIELGIPYLRYVSWSYLCMGITQIYLCIMKNTDRTFRSTVYGTVALLSNLVLNWILIYGMFGFPEMGIRGAALATTIARLIELTLVITENFKKDVVKINLHTFIYSHKELHKDFIHYTAPVMANELAWGCGFTMFSVIMGHLGNDAVAANSIANIIKNVISCVSYGLAAGSGIVIGNVLGTGELDLAKKLGDKLFKLSVIVGAISGGIILICSPLIVQFSTTLSNQARDYLHLMLFICSYYMIGKSINSTVVAGIFYAGGDTLFGFICDVVVMWLIIVPLGCIAAFVLRLPVIWVYFLLNLDEMLKIPPVYKNYRKYRWVKNITK